MIRIIYLIVQLYYVSAMQLCLIRHMFQTNYSNPNMVIGILKNDPTKSVVPKKCNTKNTSFQLQLVQLVL